MSLWNEEKGAYTKLLSDARLSCCGCCCCCWETAGCCCQAAIFPGTNPGGVNVWSAVRSALVSWYSEIKGWRKKERKKEERRWGLFYIIQLSGASILISANPY